MQMWDAVVGGVERIDADAICERIGLENGYAAPGWWTLRRSLEGGQDGSRQSCVLSQQRGRFIVGDTLVCVGHGPWYAE
jgi:hypothetical protein